MIITIDTDKVRKDLTQESEKWERLFLNWECETEKDRRTAKKYAHYCKLTESQMNIFIDYLEKEYGKAQEEKVD